MESKTSALSSFIAGFLVTALILFFLVHGHKTEGAVKMSLEFIKLNFRTGFSIMLMMGVLGLLSYKSVGYVKQLVRNPDR